MVVAVSLLDLRLAGGEVRADEAERRAVEAEADGDGALVAGGAAQTRLDRLHAHVSVSNYTSPCEEQTTQAQQSNIATHALYLHSTT